MRWVDIAGWEFRYQVSEDGRVRSKDMIVNAKGNKSARRKGRELTPVVKSNGYLCVSLSHGGVCVQEGIHRLVARAFIGVCPDGNHVLHSDGDKSNNHVSNLRYGTPADNHLDTLAHGRRLRGAAHPMAKLDEVGVKFIRQQTKATKSLAEKFGVCREHIHAIQNYRCWKHV
jgi:hypothetical protein